MDKITFTGPDPHALPKPEHLAGFTGILCAYGKPIGEEYIISKQAAMGLLKQAQDHPERFYITYEDVPYTVNRVWLDEESETTGCVMVEYGRIDRQS